MTRKLYPQPNAKADKKEYFVSIVDRTRKLYDLSGPMVNDQPPHAQVVKANEARGINWNVFTVREGPVLAYTVQQDVQNELPNYTFVDSALAPEPVPVIITTGPVTWMLP